MKVGNFKWYHWVLVAAVCVVVVIVALLVMYYTMIYDWPMNIGGKPN